MRKNKGKQRKFIYIVVFSIVVLSIGIGCGLYLNDYYRADIQAMAMFTSADNVSKKILEENTIVIEPPEPKTGFIFYPGGKVEYTAYEPLLEACARQNILCVLVEMPFNLAVFDINAADGIQEKYPEIEQWYIGGHSLGGSMAASYLAEHGAEYEGLILLGSYSTADLSASSLKVLSVYGSEDRVLNKEKYDENTDNLPDNFTEIVLEGGCHAYFGVYGAQEGDGMPTISNKEQINRTVEAIVDFIN